MKRATGIYDYAHTGYSVQRSQNGIQDMRRLIPSRHVQHNPNPTSIASAAQTSISLASRRPATLVLFLTNELFQDEFWLQNLSRLVAFSMTYMDIPCVNGYDDVLVSFIGAIPAALMVGYDLGSIVPAWDPYLKEVL